MGCGGEGLGGKGLGGVGRVGLEVGLVIVWVVCVDVCGWTTLKVMT